MELRRDEQQNQASFFLLDSLYCCEEEKWEKEEETIEQSFPLARNGVFLNFLFEEDQEFCENEELLSLFCKEEVQLDRTHVGLETLKADRLLSAARSEAVEWILTVNAHFGFTTLTAVLAINYLERFLSSLHFQRDKAWMVQLVAVTCLSLAAKVEEIEVPNLLDLQVEGTKFVFEAKTIQRMELLVLSSLQWRMHPVTPLSFLDHITRTLGFKNHRHCEFISRCESLILSLASDSRFIGYLSSVIATATMMNVIEQFETCNSLPLQNQLLKFLNIAREKVQECFNLIKELRVFSNSHLKRKERSQSSPRGVIDSFLTSDMSNDSWVSESLSSSSLYSSPEPPLKKSREETRVPSVLN